VARQIEAHAARVLETAHQHLRHRLERLALGLVEVVKPSLARDVSSECSATRPAIRRLVASGNASIGRAQVGEFGVAADRRDRAAVQDRAVSRQRLEGGVGVPQAIAELVEPDCDRRP